MNRIVFLGDSVTKANNVDVSVSFAMQIGLANGYQPQDIINAGVPGNKLADMLLRLETDVISHAPDVCAFMPMINDASHGTPLATFSAQLHSIVSQLIAAGIKVVIMSPPLYRGGTENYPKFNSYLLEVEKVVDAYRLPYIDVYRRYAWEFMLNVNSFMALYIDVIHQSATGYNYISNLCNSGRYAGYFVKDAAQGARELSIATADWALGGQTPELLQQVQLARDAITS